VASQLIEEITAPAQSDSLVDAREVCADGTYFPNNLRRYLRLKTHTEYVSYMYIFPSSFASSHDTVNII